MLTLNLLIDEGCCGIEHFKWQQAGGVGTRWECPLCGCEWTAHEIGGIIDWRCCEVVQIWR